MKSVKLSKSGDVQLEGDAFLSTLVNLANQRGLNKTPSQLHMMIKQNARVQKAYDIQNFHTLSLLDPHTLKCYYFRNKSALFWGPLEHYNIFSKEETLLDNTIYWGEWEKNISTFYTIDVDSSSHLTLLTEPQSREKILDFCSTLYAI